MAFLPSPSSGTGQMGSERFVLKSLVAESSAGEVHRAYDTEREHDVFLAILSRIRFLDGPILLNYPINQEFESILAAILPATIGSSRQTRIRRADIVHVSAGTCERGVYIAFRMRRLRGFGRRRVGGFGRPTKRIVLERAAGQCEACGMVVGAKLELDHVRPLSMGGSSGADNAQALCTFCHAAKTSIERRISVRNRKFYVRRSFSENEGSSRCLAITLAGHPCHRSRIIGMGFCWSHLEMGPYQRYGDALLAALGSPAVANTRIAVGGKSDPDGSISGILDR